jgi:predicted AlkP superfamily phosphohydrolase/phosphomutase
LGTKTLYVGLDSAEPRLIARWTADGTLPTLGRLLAAGTVRRIDNYRGLSHGCYWPSIHTRRTPAEHGRYFNRQLVPGTYRIEDFPSTRCSGLPLWADLERDGARVAAVDMARTPPAGLVRGVEVVNWLAHDPDSPLATTPAPLGAELVRRFGADPFLPGLDAFVKRCDDLEVVAAACARRIDWKTAWCVEQLGRRAWDFFAVTYHDAHDLGHLAWHLHDATHPAFDPALRARIGDPLERAMRGLDAALGALIAAAGPGATVIVVTGPGMETNSTGNNVLPEILARLDRGPPRGPASGAAGAGPAPAPTVSPLRRAYHALAPAAAKRALRRTKEALLGTDEERARGAARWFALPHADNSGGVRLNVRGREPRGRIGPGRERARALEELSAALAELRDGAGRPAVADVVAVDEGGTARTGLPDLIVVWNRAADFRTVESPRIGRVERARLPRRTGDHTEQGDLIVATPLALPEILEHEHLTPDQAGVAILELARAGAALDVRTRPASARRA